MSTKWDIMDIEDKEVVIRAKSGREYVGTVNYINYDMVAILTKKKAYWIYVHAIEAVICDLADLPEPD